LGGIERLIYRICRVAPEVEMSWQTDALQRRARRRHAAGALRRDRADATSGTLRTDSTLVVGLLIAHDKSRNFEKRPPAPRAAAIRTDEPPGGYPRRVQLGRMSGGPLRCPTVIVLEISLIVLSVVAFALFDLYARACDRI
jgi:hypothetical protein